MGAVWYRADHVMPDYMRCDAFLALSRQAVAAGWLISVKRSNITRGWTYNAEIAKIVDTGRTHEDGSPIRNYVSHGAGQGTNPLIAIIDAVRLCGIRTPLTLATILEAEAWLLARAVERARAREALTAKLDAALDDLTAILRSVNVPAPTTLYDRMVAAMPRYEDAATLAASNDEDDDL